MKCKLFESRVVGCVIIGICAILSLTCKESLPVYTPPGNVLTVQVTTVEQLNDHIAPPTAQMVHLLIVGENTHDEIIWDSVDIKGTMLIWWKRNPSRSRTIYLTEKNFTDPSLIQNGKLMLVPGQQFSMDVYWDVKTDDGIYLPEEMDWRNYSWQLQCAANVICAAPETFIAEVSLNVYDRLGPVAAPPRVFTFIGRFCICWADPPCGTGGEC